MTCYIEFKITLMKYVLMRFYEWHGLRIAMLDDPTIPTMNFHGVGNSSGVMLVYDTLEALRAEHPDAPYMVLQLGP